MEINVTLAGQFVVFAVVVAAVIIGVVSYYLGRRKTQTPIVAGILGGILGLIPVLGLAYLVVLMLKNDVGCSSPEKPGGDTY